MAISRRTLLLSLGGAALFGAGFAASVPRRLTVTRRGWALGSDVAMTVLAESREQAERGLDAAFAELETVEQVMSLYRPDSQLSRLNRDKSLRDPHPYLRQVLTTAAAISQQS